ncbi:MAG: DEAD/DEAH box helicase [Actinobacteria bacterium]|nr:DEAD/DEAH box helicase [Actinomycetota bacterium]
MSDRLSEFWDRVEFTPDEFQLEAAEAIDDGSSVVVTAPTGAGKTLVAEAAIHLALDQGKRSFYTTPIKALSNQKFADLSEKYGSDRVGLLTGDNVINPKAPVIVATLEVLRNMIYADAGQLHDVAFVVLDEAHYLQDRSRGAAWEEVIIHCPRHVQFVCLSATISNNKQFADWVGERRGSTRLITTEERPVPLESMYMLKDRMGSHALHLLPTFVIRDGRRRANPRLEHMLGLERGRKRRFKTPNRIETIEALASENMLPAIYFIFSRAGCDAAVNRLMEAGVRLTDPEERQAIREIAEGRTAHLGGDDLDVLGYDRWMVGLDAGVASHHAGLVPAYKEAVEELFELGYLKVVFATETLALGINMPARSVVIENLSKFNGESHELLRPGDYTQLTGRAGRRGIDVEGFGVLLHSPFVRFSQVTEIASIGAHELRSSFRPTYNMTANLIANYRQDETEALLEASFAAFQRDDDRADAGDAIAALEHRLTNEEKQAECERGSVEEYLALIEALDPKRHNDGIAATLRTGDVLDIVGGPRDGRYTVLKRLARKNGSARYLVLSTSGRVSTVGSREIPSASRRAGKLDLPTPLKPRDRRFVQETLRRLRKVPPVISDGSPQRRKLVEHPVAECPDASRHLAASRRANRVRRRLEQHRALRRSSGFGLVEEFQAIRQLLEELGYTEGWSLTPRGERLRRIYNETDLLLAEAMEKGYLYGLEPAELASLLSAFVYEPRTDQASVAEWPTPELHARWSDIEMLWKDLTTREKGLRLSPTRRPDPGFGILAYQWASEVAFDDLDAHGMAPGDFVRVSRQLADLLRQIRDGVSELREEAMTALISVDRGVVAAQGVG